MRAQKKKHKFFFCWVKDEAGLNGAGGRERTSKNQKKEKI